MNVIKISMKDCHILAKTEDGRLLAWGVNSSGQLGTNKTSNSSKPVLINLNGHKVVDIATGRGFSVVLAEAQVTVGLSDSALAQEGTEPKLSSAASMVEGSSDGTDLKIEDDDRSSGSGEFQQ